MEDFFDEKKPKRKNNDYFFDDFRDETSFAEKDKIKDKVTSLKNFVDLFQKRMEGYEFVSGLDKMTYTGNVLAGSRTIQKLVALLSPFSENTNLIGEQRLDEFYRKKHRIHSTANAILFTSMDVLPENYNAIIEAFKNTFININNVMNGSKSLLRPQFSDGDRGFTPESDI